MSLRFLVARLANAVVIMFVVALIAFSMIYVVPGDPARLMLGERASAADVAALRENLGFDRPILTQFLDYMGGLLRGDFGESFRAQRPSLDVVTEALPATLKLVVGALLVAFGVGIPMGILAAVRRGRLFDRVALGTALIGQSVPAFWIGLVLIAVVSLRWGLLPTSGYGGFEHLLLPTLCLVPYILGMILRVTRIAVLEVLEQDYVRTARAKGLSPWVVVGKHALRNAGIPIVTVMGLQIGALLGGAVVTETVFAWPGIGRLAVDSLASRDWPVVRTVILIAAFGLVLINLTVDIVYSVIDRRIRFQ